MVIVLCAGLLLPFMPLQAEAKAVNNFDITDFKGLKLSIVGDSISSYDGISNNTDYNTNIGDNWVWYGNGAAGRAHVTRADTWWQQAIDVLGMELCVNNSWSGSYLLYGHKADAYKDLRMTNLHNNNTGAQPDIIAFHMGTNDCKEMASASAVGTVSKAKTMTAASTPTTTLEAYAVMLKQAQKHYPNAELYCFTLLPEANQANAGNIAAYEAFNAGIKELAKAFGCHVVDAYSIIGTNRVTLDQIMLDNLHPDLYGMDAMTNCFVSSLLENSKHMEQATYGVTYDRLNTFVEVGNVAAGREFFGDVTTAVAGKPFSVELGSAGIENINFTVTMGGEDITLEAVHGDVVTIRNVTGDIVIRAEEAPDNFYWVPGTRSYVTNPDFAAKFTNNPAGLISGTHVKGEYGTDTATGDAVYQLDQPVVLHHSRPWVVEFQADGTDSGGYAGGILLMSNTKTSTGLGNTYIHLNQSQFLLGYYGGDPQGSGDSKTTHNYTNSGFGWDTIAAAIGSSKGNDIRNDKLSFTLENRVNADGSNMVYLRVNGTTVGAMNDETSNNASLSGVDFVFNYIGSETHPLQSCSVSYIKIYENGAVNLPKDEPNNFRWVGVGEWMTSAGDVDTFTENVLDLEMGCGTNGVHDEPTYYSLDKPVTLLHDRAWNIEFKAKGDWGAGSGEDPMIFSGSGKISNNKGNYHLYNETFIWRNSSNFIGFGHRNDESGVFHNYGVDMSDLGLQPEWYYTYRLENRVEYDASGNYAGNMVWLYINDEPINAFTRYQQNSTLKDANSTWLSGKDFVFNYLGNYDFPISGVTFDYIQVWEDGSQVNTLRLEYLINTARDLSGAYTNTQDYTDTTWEAYVAALNAGQAMLADVTATQAKVDAAVDNIIFTRNALISTASTTKIYSVESVTGGKAALGMQCGIKVVTSPDVAQVCVGTQTLIINSSEVQTMLIDGVATKVKVWFLSWQYSATTDKTQTFDVGAWKTYSADHKGTSSSDPDAHTTVKITFSNTYALSSQVLSNPTKTTYVAGEKFDSTGTKLEITYSNGDVAVLTIKDKTTASLAYTKAADGTTTTSTVTNFSYDNGGLETTTEKVGIYYDGAAVSIPVTVSE